VIDYNKKLNPTAASLKPSGIRRFFDISEQMENVISLGVGEPDFQTPWHIRHAGIESLEGGKTRYTANRGMEQLRKEITNYMKRRFNLSYDPNEVLVTVGGSEAIDYGLEEFICDNSKNNIIFIEWSENIKEILNGKYIQVNIKLIDENKRKFEIIW